LALPEINLEEHGIDWRVLKEEAVAFRESLIKGAVRADVSGMDGGSDSSSEGAM